MLKLTGQTLFCTPPLGVLESTKKQCVVLDTASNPHQIVVPSVPVYCTAPLDIRTKESTTLTTNKFSRS